MSFDLEDIAEEISSAAGMGREWFAKDSFSTFTRSQRKRQRRKSRTPEEKRRYNSAWMRKKRARDPFMARLAEALNYQRMPPEKKALRTAKVVEQNRKRREKPEVKQRSRELALGYYYERMKDPAKRAALQKYQRERYQALKAAKATQP